MLRLLVMRHAKSDWDAGAVDHARPLNGRGRRTATAMGDLLARIGEVPDVVLCSSARRARETLALAVEGGNWSSELHHDDALYGTTVGGTLDVIRGAPDAERLMVVGHDPTWTGLVRELTGAEVAMKTGTVVGLDLAADHWRDLAPSATIAFVLQPRHWMD